MIWLFLLSYPVTRSRIVTTSGSLNTLKYLLHRKHINRREKKKRGNYSPLWWKWSNYQSSKCFLFLKMNTDGNGQQQLIKPNFRFLRTSKIAEKSMSKKSYAQNSICIWACAKHVGSKILELHYWNCSIF